MNEMRFFIPALLSVLLLSGCGDNGASEGPVKRSWGKMKGLEELVGNMKDTSYSNAGTQKPRLNALGKPVAMTDFKGSFVWAEYAAPWCKACTWQAPETMKVEKELGKSIVFLTIMTSQSSKYNDHATVQTAKDWSGRYGLDPARVLAAELWFKTIPEHRFYSPKGHTLFVHVGALSSQQIKDVISYYKEGYDSWAKTGNPAEWMSTSR